MIKINLAKRKMAAVSNAEADAKTGAFAGIKKMFDRGRSSDSGGLSEWPVKAIVISMLGIFGSENWFAMQKAEDIGKIEARIAKQQQIQSQLQEKLTKTAGLEELQNNLKADELLVKTKLDVIMSLMQDRQKSAGLLKGVSLSIPQEVWLQSLTIGEADVELAGRALDYNLISDFMNQLGQNGVVADLLLENSTQSKEENGINLASFKLTGKRK